MRRLFNLIMIPLMPCAAAGYNNLEHASPQTQARDAASVEAVGAHQQHSFESVTARTQTISDAHRLIEGDARHRHPILRQGFGGICAGKIFACHTLQKQGIQ